MRYEALLLSAFTALTYALPTADPKPQGEVLGPGSAGFPEWATVENITVAGTGCPANSVVSKLSGDRTILHLSFDSFWAEYFAGSKKSDQTRNCNVNVRVRYPPGYSLTVATVDTRGFAIMDASCTATLGGRMWWSGQAQDASCQAVIPGPAVGEYTKTVVVPQEQFVWSQCGAEGPLFNVDTRVLAQCKNKNDEAYISVDAQDTSIKTYKPFQWNMRLQWKRC